MKVKSLNGRIENWNLAGYTVFNDETRPRSSLHLKARELLRAEMPTESILEEVAIPSENLYLDFYIPLRKLAIEIHGEQHYTYSRHFHGNIEGFRRARNNDGRKAEWCRLNNIQLMIFPFNKTVEEWRGILYG